MKDRVTKEDMQQFGQSLIGAIAKMLDSSKGNAEEAAQPEWLKGRAVRKMLDISAGSLQNLRVTGKIRFKKVLGSYYYNRADLHSLFSEKEERHGT